MKEKLSTYYNDAVQKIKSAILQSQAKALAGINQEQLALYYGIGRYISRNSRSGYWGTDAIDTISRQLMNELPGLRGFSSRNLRNMRLFYEEWNCLDSNLAVATAKSGTEEAGFEMIPLTKIPVTAFFSIGFTHHIAILSGTKTEKERKFYIQLCFDQRLTVNGIQRAISDDLYHHKRDMPNNFLQTIPDHKQALKAIEMFKDEYLLDFINVEQYGVREEDVDERVIENGIIHNIRHFIMTFGKGFSFIGNQVHFDKLGHDHWVDILFFNRILKSLVVVELKKGVFKPGYLGQLSHYLHILDDDERLEGENPSVGVILCKDADRTYVEYVLQDYNRPMGVATYKIGQKNLMDLLPDIKEMTKLL